MVDLGYGESVFGGVGTGLYTMLLYVLLAVFIGGLMVGRTPEFLGKKVEAREIKLVSLGVLVTPLAVLLATCSRWRPSTARPSIFASGPQGFSESLYAYMSQANNNGSAFAGYTGYYQPEPGNIGAHGITFADLLGGVTMLGARFVPILLVLAVAGALAGKRVAPAGLGTLRTDTPTFVGLLGGTVVLIGALTFFPALLLGPVVQGLTDRSSDHEAQQRTHHLRHRRRGPHGAPRRRLSARHDRDLAGRVPQQGRRLAGQGRRQGRRLAPDRQGLRHRHRQEGLRRQPDHAARPEVLPAAPVADATTARPARSSPTAGPNSAVGRFFYRDALAAYLALERPYNPGLTAAKVPVDAVTTSASGVDPHISKANAAHPGAPHRRRAPAAARPRRRSSIADNTDGRFLGVLGEPGVNVLELNLALDKEASAR